MGRAGAELDASAISGLSPHGRLVVARLEYSRFWPGAAAEALISWAWIMRDPYHRLFDPEMGCGVMRCCPDPEELRRIFEAVAHALPPRDARVFRRRLALLDAQW
jgi:hypothetical protein